MTKVVVAMSMSLDGIAGPESADADGMALFTAILGWQFPLRSWRQEQGMDGGEDSVDSRVWADNFGRFGPQVIGRTMFDFGYPNWGENPPFHAPVFVVTHRGQERIEKGGGTSYTFVTSGIAAAVEQARAVRTGRTSCWPAGSASPGKGWPRGWWTRSCCTWCRSWWGGEFGCSTVARWICGASRVLRARERFTCATRCGSGGRPSWLAPRVPGVPRTTALPRQSPGRAGINRNDVTSLRL